MTNPFKNEPSLIPPKANNASESIFAPKAPPPAATTPMPTPTPAPASPAPSAEEASFALNDRLFSKPQEVTPTAPAPDSAETPSALWGTPQKAERPSLSSKLDALQAVAQKPATTQQTEPPITATAQPLHSYTPTPPAPPSTPVAEESVAIETPAPPPPMPESPPLAEASRPEIKTPEIKTPIPAPIATAMPKPAAAAAPTDSNNLLEVILQQHESWLKSEGAEGRRAVFHDMDLKGEDFGNRRLDAASFRGLNLSGTCFANAQLAEADFSDAILDNTDFSAANLDSAIFQQAQGSRTNFTDIQAFETNFSGAEMLNANFDNAHLEGATFRDANLRESALTKVESRLANYRGADLTRADMRGGNFTQASFRDAKMTAVQLAEANLLQANFKDAKLEQISLNATDFSQAVDISPHLQNEFVQMERERLRKEKQRLDQFQMNLEEREKRIIAERDKLEVQKSAPPVKNPAAPPPSAEKMEKTIKPRELLQTPSSQMKASNTPVSPTLLGNLQRAGRLFIALGISWLVIALLAAFIVISAIAEMEASEISGLGIIVFAIVLIAPTALFAISIFKSFSLAKQLRDTI